MANNSNRKAIEFLVQGALPPHSTNVLWMDTSVPDKPILKIWWNGAWVSVHYVKDDGWIKPKIVPILPARGESDVLYLVPLEHPETQNLYAEYLWVENAWEKIGSEEVDLSDYYTKEEIAELLTNKQDALTEGDNISIDENNSISALGYTYNTTKHSFAESTSTASGFFSHAEGQATQALGVSSHSEGYNTVAGENYSHAEGYLTIAQNEAEHAEGKYNVSHNIIPDDFVDLNLPSGTLWAKYNVGATHESTPESWYGHYYQWGDPDPADAKNCGWSIYKYGSASPFSKYDTDGKAVLEAIDDPVTVACGANYHSPTKEQIEELCTLSSTWVTNYNGISGLNGRVFTGTNGNTIFIPAAGFRNVDTSSIATESLIWSSSLCLNDSTKAYRYFSNVSSALLSREMRCYGYSVRPVTALRANTIHSIGIGRGLDDRKNAVEVMDNGDVYVKNIGNYDGTNPSSATRIQDAVAQVVTLTQAEYDALVQAGTTNPTTLYIISDVI